MKVSVIATVYNEIKSIETFIMSLISQSKLPDEIVIVDGGSNDGTTQIIESINRQYPFIHLIIDNKCNLQCTPSPVAKGRNIAIQHAHGDIIAVTDAGCRIDRHWLMNISEPFVKDTEVEVVGGWYEPWVETFFERAAATVTFSISKSDMAKIYFPSSRSIAFKKSLWLRIGGYPEVTLTAEDSLFNELLRENNAKYIFTDKAIVYWRPRGNIKEFVRQFFRYSKGDAICGLHFRMHFLKTIKYTTIFVLIIFPILDGYKYVFFLFLIIILYLYVLYMKDKNGTLFFLSVLLKIIADMARLVGYFTGCFKKINKVVW
jgi:glycosyltransferase involved in cell wall biosynthesis